MGADGRRCWVLEGGEVLWGVRADRACYLDPLVECARSSSFPVATLNYDNALELRAEALGVSLTTGINEFRRDHAVPTPDEGIEPLKLHGSVLWRWRGADQPMIYDPDLREHRALHRQLEELGPEQLTKSLDELTKHTRSLGTVPGDLNHVANVSAYADQAGIIFGGRNKLRADGPFPELFVRFREHLNRSSEVITIGYSYRDTHINHCLISWLLTKRDRKLIVVGKGPLDNHHPLRDWIWLPRFSYDVKYERCGVEEAIIKYFGRSKKLPEEAQLPERE